LKSAPKNVALIILSVLLILLCSANPAFSGEQVVVKPESLDAFFDSFFYRLIDENELPGAVIVVVQNSELVFSRGYGYADLKDKIEVSPSETIFFVESVSKSFTATAVMQLVDDGLMDLNTDVNDYITAFQLPVVFAQPVTVADLLVHTGGFDDTDIGAYAKNETEVIPLRVYLAHNMPARVMPPGEITSYSNHGYALAGLVVEEVTGTPFATYMDQKILGPLEMRSSSFVLSGEMARRLASPYLSAGSGFHRGNFLFHNYSPAGGLKATAEDMAKFITAHLQGGQFMENRILSAGALELMHSQQFTNHGELPGWTYGFYEKFLNGRRIIMHGGANRLGHMSEMIIIPDEEIGFFFASNTFNPAVRNKLVMEFMNQFFPADEEVTVPATLSPDPHTDSRYAGRYQSTRQARNSMEKIIMLMGQLEIKLADDKLRIIYPQGSIASEASFLKIGQGLFQNREDGALLAFREDGNDNITHMFLDIEAYERVPWYIVPAFQGGLLILFILVFLSIVFKKSSIKHVLKENEFNASAVLYMRSLRAARFLAGLNTLFLVGVVLIFLNYQVELAYGVPTVVKLLFAVPFASLALTAAVFYFCILIWKGAHYSLAYRLHYFIFTIISVWFILFLNYWNLLGIL
jgi:CubicO group peptidase (beta-lactamase class C family)